VIRDLKITRNGTITFMSNVNAHEIDYDANILWSAHDAKTEDSNIVQQYHHEFTKLSNGHFMTIGNIRSIENTVNNEVRINSDSGTKKIMPCGYVIEYDTKSNIAWKWNSCNSIGFDDASSHFNSFYFDEKKLVVYTSYRNFNTIIKTEYPSGRLLATYNGGRNGIFYYQHNVSLNNDGNLLLFNNNFKAHLAAKERNTLSICSIAVFKEPATATDTLQKIWEFTCDFDTLASAISPGGGSVQQLSDGDYLVCTGLPGRDFIVSKDKKVLWNILVEENKNGWKPFGGYRISPVTPNQLHKLIFRQQ